MVHGAWLGVEALCRTQYGVVSRAQLVGLGLRPRAIDAAIARGRLVRVMRNLYRFAQSELSWEHFGFGLTQLLAPGSALSHLTAGFLWSLPDCAPPQRTTLHLTVPGLRVLELPHGAQLHRTRIPLVNRVLKQNMYVTQISRTLIDLAPMVSEPQLARMLDAANHRFSAVGTWIRNELKLFSRGGRAGLGTLARLLDERTGLRPIESPLETDVFRALKTAALPPMLTQFEIADPATRTFVARADFAWPEHQVAVFADSRLFHWNREAFDRDAAQRTQLVGIGWTVIIVTRAMLTKGTWLTDLRRTLERRAPQRPLFVLDVARSPRLKS